MQKKNWETLQASEILSLDFKVICMKAGLPYNNADFSPKKSETPLNKPELTAAKPELALNKPETPLNKPELTLNKPELALNKPDIDLYKPELVLNKPELTLNKPEIALYKSKRLPEFFREPFLFVPLSLGEGLGVRR
ncbi:MAG TPA: hypothetical protein VI757_13125 [Bacteroidia bacterium]|nr:hypothetical protein [Bacteroidia bacterium]